MQTTRLVFLLLCSKPWSHSWGGCPQLKAPLVWVSCHWVVTSTSQATSVATFA